MISLASRACAQKATHRKNHEAGFMEVKACIPDRCHDEYTVVLFKVLERGYSIHLGPHAMVAVYF